LGGTGVGKSKFCSVLLEGEDLGAFVSSSSAEGGETKIITSRTGFALGNSKPIKIFDIPGLCDPELPLKDWMKQINE
jgi:hypothetical protein